MSLINKMLQDLDARGSQGSEAMTGNIKSVVRPEASVSMPLVAAGLLGAGALAVAGVFGWRYFSKPAAPAAPSVVVASAVVAPAVPVKESVPVTAAVPVPVPESTPKPEPAKSVPSEPKVLAAPREQSAPERPPVIARAPVTAAVPDVPRVAAPVDALPLTAPQRAESEYRRALATLQEGRIGDSIARLEQTLTIDPRHEAARQTLVGLLLEDGRADDAMAQMQAGLALDARQPALAMLLARLQIERGGSGVDTLQRSLPAGTGNADYHAFLAGALQREKRHAEAAEQYRAALRSAPDNGVWLMGLGISLQADKRSADARDAFQRAKASGKLTPQLQAFVDSQLQQLSSQ